MQYDWRLTTGHGQLLTEGIEELWELTRMHAVFSMFCNGNLWSDRDGLCYTFTYHRHTTRAYVNGPGGGAEKPLSFDCGVMWSKVIIPVAGPIIVGRAGSRGDWSAVVAGCNGRLPTYHVSRQDIR